MLSGQTPFALGANDPPEEIVKRMGEGKIKLDSPTWEKIGEQAKDLVLRLLTVDVTRRYSLKQILSHPWITERHNLPCAELPAVSNNDTEALKAALEQTYRARNATPVVSLCPVNTSALAQRRLKRSPHHHLPSSALNLARTNHPMANKA